MVMVLRKTRMYSGITVREIEIIGIYGNHASIIDFLWKLDLDYGDIIERFMNIFKLL